MSSPPSKRYRKYLSCDGEIPRRTAYRRRQCCNIHTCEFNQPFEDSCNQPKTNNEETLNSVEAVSGGNTSDQEPFPFKASNKPLFPSSNVTNIEAFISILAFSVRFNLTLTCMEELLNLLQLLLPPNCNIPGTNYLFYKKIPSVFDNTCGIHIYCIVCKSHICKLSDEEKPNICPICTTPVKCEENIQKGYFFLYMPLQPQLKLKFEKQNIMKDIYDYKASFANRTADVVYRDILDGDLYHSVDELKDINNISLQFNIDGIPVYRKAKHAMWPIQCAINELHPWRRKHNIMMCGLWFGPEKPDMNSSFLKPFVEEMELLSGEGFLWCNRLDASMIKTRVFPVLCTSDAPARAALQNFTQFNGKNGCGFCEAEGLQIEKGKGTCRIYPLGENLSPKRTYETTLEYAESAATADVPVVGVKGPSELAKLYPYFNMVTGFVPDYMHAVLLGVTRQFLNLWTDPSNLPNALSTKRKKELEKRIGSLRLPDEVTRKLRPLKEISFWKASEWRIFLLTSPLLLINLLNCDAYKHWLLLVHGVTALLNSNISLDDLLCAELALHKFVWDIEGIYGCQELTYNVHLLLHMTDSVRCWGPLWAHSCFMFEDSLGKLKSFHKGTNGVPNQVLTSYLNLAILKMLISENSFKNPRIETFVSNMQRGHKLTKNVSKVGDCTLFGKGNYDKFPHVQRKALEKIINIKIDIVKILTYKRVFYSERMYSTKDYCKRFSRANYMVSIAKNICIEILNVIVFKNEVFFVGGKLITTRFHRNDCDLGLICNKILHVDDGPYNIIAFRPCDIKNKYIILPVVKENISETYLIPLINDAEQ